MNDLQQKIFDRVLKGSEAINNALPVTRMHVIYLLACDDEEFKSMYNSKMSMFQFIGSSDDIEKAQARAKSLNLL